MTKTSNAGFLPITHTPIIATGLALVETKNSTTHILQTHLARCAQPQCRSRWRRPSTKTISKAKTNIKAHSARPRVPTRRQTVRQTMQPQDNYTWPIRYPTYSAQTQNLCTCSNSQRFIYKRSTGTWNRVNGMRTNTRSGLKNVY